MKEHLANLLQPDTSPGEAQSDTRIFAGVDFTEPTKIRGYDFIRLPRWNGFALFVFLAAFSKIWISLLKSTKEDESSDIFATLCKKTWKRRATGLS